MKAKDLRNSILQLAVQGKLVPQDPNDEPASVLLERIRAERARLIKEKKIKAPKGGESVIYRASDGSHYEKRSKGEPVCIDDEIPFEIPESWAWCRYFTIADTLAGFAFKSSDFKSAGRYRLFRGINLGVNQIRWDDTVFIDNMPSKAAIYELKTGDVLLGLDRPWISDGLRTAIIEEAEDTYLVQRVLRIRQTPAADARWLRLLLTTPLLSSVVAQDMTGISVPHISEGQVTSILVPLPPISEQRRIADSIAQIMPLVDGYGALESARTRLDAELPDRLRKSILQMAVQGKLVPQDPNDEPASILIDRIRAERAVLVKAGELKAPRGGESVIYRGSDGGYYEKRGKDEPVCIDDEIPFEIPESWAWARLESVTTYIQRGKSPKYSPIKEYPVVAQKCNQWSGFSLELAKFVDPATVSSYAEERILQDGDLLWNSTGLGTLGRMAVYDSSVNEYGWAVADSHVTVIRTLPGWLDYRYAFAYFAGPSVQSVIEDRASGSTKQKELAQDTVRSYLIPIPPRCEQTRIAERLREILPRLTNR